VVVLSAGAAVVEGAEVEVELPAPESQPASASPINRAPPPR